MTTEVILTGTRATRPAHHHSGPPAFRFEADTLL